MTATLFQYEAYAIVDASGGIAGSVPASSYMFEAVFDALGLGDIVSAGVYTVVRIWCMPRETARRAAAEAW
jgi:hypothetical protein